MIEDQRPELPDNEPIQEMETPRKNWKTWVAAGGCLVFICGALLTATLVFAGPKIARTFFPAQVAAAEEKLYGITQNNTMGDPEAPIKIVEYGDFQCPYCLQFWQETEPQLIEEYINTGIVYFEFRSFPVIGPESYSAAEGAYCAGDQGKFWEYHDTLFTNWTGENVGDFTQEKLIEYAESLALDMQKFEQCLSEGAHKSTVEQDRAQGEADHVRATPTFLINGNLVEGAQPFEVIKHIIEEILNNGIDTGTG